MRSHLLRYVYLEMSRSMVYKSYIYKYMKIYCLRGDIDEKTELCW